MNRKHAGLFYLVLIYIVSLFKLNLKEKIFSSKVKSEIKKKRSYRILVSCNEKNKLTTFNRFYEILDPPEKNNWRCIHHCSQHDCNLFGISYLKTCLKSQVNKLKFSLCEKIFCQTFTFYESERYANPQFSLFKLIGKTGTFSIITVPQK